MLMSVGSGDLTPPLAGQRVRALAWPGRESWPCPLSLTPQGLEVTLSPATVHLALVMAETRESSYDPGSQCGHISENQLLVKLFLHSLLFPPLLCLSHRCLWLSAWEWSWFTAGMLGCLMYAGKGALGVGSLL